MSSSGSTGASGGGHEARRTPPRRPRALTPGMMDLFAEESLDPAVVTQLAHESAALIVGAARDGDDPGLTGRLVALVEDVGLDAVAELWAACPPRSLPGALWRLYALREWVRRDPAGSSADYTAGLPYADVAGVIAGAASPPGPTELRDLADAILRGVFEGDVAVALERASSFCRVVAAGRGARDTAPSAGSREEIAMWPDDLRRGAAMLTMAEDLHACARAWSAGKLS